MRKNIKKTVLTGAILTIMSILTGCFNNDSKPEYPQFTTDELSHLYFNRDSLIYNGKAIYFQDTLAFLHNSKDTMFVKVGTQIYDFPQPWNSSLYQLFGESFMDFDEKSVFVCAGVHVIKDFPYSDADLTINFEVVHGVATTVNLNEPLDTALVLGRIYNNVYKFKFPENSPSKVKCIFFAKKYGFIKIESTDGKKLEKMDLSKEEIRTNLSY